MKRNSLIVILICIFFIPCKADAGGAMMQRRNAQQQVVIQRQAVIQRQIQLKQMQKAKEAAQQQAAQAVYEHQKQEIQKVMVEKALVERQVAMTQQQAMQQAMVAQRQAMQQAVMAQQAAVGQQQAIQQEMIERKVAQEMATEKAIQEKMYQVLEDDAQGVQDVVTLDDLVSSLDQSAQAWPLIIDAEAKQIVVERYIQRFKERGININNGALFYAYLVDDMSKNAPQMLQQSFEKVLEVVAIIQYDFDNGQDKDAMARQILGPEEFERNRQRLLNR